MNIFQSFQISRDRNVTVANLIDELLRRKGDGQVSIENGEPYSLAELHAEVCARDAFLRRAVGLKPGQPVAVYRTNDTRCLRWFLAIIRAGGIAVPLNPMLSLTEVRRIMETSGTDILVTDKAAFERSIQSRDALHVFCRNPHSLPPPSIPPQPLPYFTPPGPADFQRARPFPAVPCLAAARPR
jgi:acyl-CoA synthetase (AMP-forming)/AMP-acid ligase II